jgi:hypothetical protein
MEPTTNQVSCWITQGRSPGALCSSSETTNHTLDQTNRDLNTCGIHWRTKYCQYPHFNFSVSLEKRKDVMLVKLDNGRRVALHNNCVRDQPRFSLRYVFMLTPYFWLKENPHLVQFPIIIWKCISTDSKVIKDEIKKEPLENLDLTTSGRWGGLGRWGLGTCWRWGEAGSCSTDGPEIRVRYMAGLDR